MHVECSCALNHCATLSLNSTASIQTVTLIEVGECVLGWEVRRVEKPFTSYQAVMNTSTAFAFKKKITLAQLLQTKRPNWCEFWSSYRSPCNPGKVFESLWASSVK